MDVNLLVSPPCIPERSNELPYKLIPVYEWSLRHLHRLIRAVKHLNPDIVHLIYPAKAYGYALSPIISPYILLALGYVNVLTLHEFKMAHPLRKLADLALMLPMAGVLVPSSSERSAIVRVAPFLASRIRVSTAGPTIRPIWISECERQMLRAELGIGSEEFVIAYFGFVHPHKGTTAVLKAFSHMLKHAPNSRLIVIGEFHPQRDKYHRLLLELSLNLNLSSRILWVGAQPSEVVSKLLQICDAALLPFPDGASTRRGTLIVCVQHGLPTVTVRGEPEVEMRFGRALLFVDSPEDYEGMAERLIMLRDDLGKEMKMAALSIMRSWDEAWDEIASHTVKLYIDALKQSSKARP